MKNHLGRVVPEEGGRGTQWHILDGYYPRPKLSVMIKSQLWAKSVRWSPNIMGDVMVPETLKKNILQYNNCLQEGRTRQDGRLQIREEDVLWCCMSRYISVSRGF